MSSLSDRKCIPCEGGVPPLASSKKIELLKEIDSSWQLTHNNRRLERSLELKGFQNPMKLAYEVGLLADEQWHHPDLHISFNKIRIEIWTHKINNLVESDYVFAAKVDNIINNFIEVK